jgi:hypothetical protein
MQLVVYGNAFRDAYKLVAEQLEKNGSFSASKTKHTQ